MCLRNLEEIVLCYTQRVNRDRKVSGPYVDDKREL